VAAVTSAMMITTCTVGTLGTWAAWHRYQVAVAYAAGEPGTGVADYVSSDNTAANLGVLWLLACATTGVTFLTWAWRARHNAERLSSPRHRLHRGWVIAGWLVPAFPLIVLEDVWRTSRPDVPAVEHVRELPRTALVHYWWYATLACVLAVLWLAGTRSGDPTLEVLLNIASATTVLAVLQVVAAVLAIALVSRITRWQCAERPGPRRV
jgi:Domain of unknown function (DUF4328)